MSRYYLLIGLAIIAATFGTRVDASSDSTCYPQWTPIGDSRCADTAQLSPYNDTRTNLLLLLADNRRFSAEPQYPDAEFYDERGRNFFDWGQLSRALFPRPEDKGPDNDFTGSRCASFASGSLGFQSALADAKSVSAKERDILSEARAALYGICAGKELSKWQVESLSDEKKFLLQPKWPDSPPSLKSRKSKEYFTYLQGAKAFYEEDFILALNSFTELSKSKDDWLRETAIYMIGRTELNRAQYGAYGEYGDFTGADAVNRDALQNAERIFKKYLKNIPNGLYARSASGLMRRIFWLGGNHKKLAVEYHKALNGVDASDLSALVREIDNKLLLEEDARQQISDPMLLATVDLMLMRTGEDIDLPTISRADLEKQRPLFSANIELHQFLLAAHSFFVEGKSQAVLKLVPDDARQERFSYLQFSRQALRGLALHSLGDRNEAGFWRDMIAGSRAIYQRPFVELSLAANLEHSGKLAEIFAANSLIQDSTIREILLKKVAGPSLLNRVMIDKSRSKHERDLALFVLLYKQLTRGDYSDFIRNRTKIVGVPKEAYLGSLHAQEKIPLGSFSDNAERGEFSCPTLSKTVGSLAKNPKDVRSRLCLGDFYRLNGFDDFDDLDRKQPKDELGSSKSQFLGSYNPRQKFYTDIMDDRRAKADDRAYALYRAVYCYAPGGYNSCRGEDVAVAQRKNWFRRLKREYPKSKWAKKLRYYW